MMVPARAKPDPVSCPADFLMRDIAMWPKMMANGERQVRAVTKLTTAKPEVFGVDGAVV